jgi:anti-anti-sigma factor
VAGCFDTRVVTVPPATTRVAVVGDVDLATGDQLFEALAGALAWRGIRRLEVDLDGVRLLDAHGVGVLLAARNRALEQATDFQVSGANGLALQVLEVTGVLGVLGAKS